MGLVIKLAYAAVVFGIGAIIFAVLEEYDLGHWFGIVLCLGALLPWGVDLFQGNQVRCFRGEYGKGVCGTLKQDAYVVALFVDDEVSSWTSEEIEVFMESNVKDGLEYIESQAEAYGQNTSLRFGYYRENGIAKKVALNQKIDDCTGIKEWTAIKNSLILHQIARKLGYANAWHMLASDRKTTGMQQIAYLVCVNKPGRAYAHNDKTELFFYDAPEYGVLYAYHPDSDVLTTSAGVAHELLHLFGAEDYYAEGRERLRRSQLAEILCPQDVMFDGNVDVWTKNVGRFTAYTIGWLDHLPEEYKRLNWWR